MRKDTMMRRAALGLLALWCCAAEARATQGLQTKFAEVEVKNLKIGGTYSLLERVNLPLRVTNTGTEPLDLQISAWPPIGGENKEGFEAIPDPSWIRLSQSTFTVFPGMEGVTDVVISIPNDEKLLGRRFLAYVWTESKNKTALAVALKSRLLIFVSSAKPTEEELKRKFVARKAANLNFSFAPMEVLAEEVPVGRKVALKDLKANVKLINPNESPYHFQVTSVGLWETSISPPPGFSGAPDPKWLRVPKPVFEAQGDSFTPLNAEIEIPDAPGNRGKSFLFLLRAEILEQELPAYAYAKVLVRTQR